MDKKEQLLSLIQEANPKVISDILNKMYSYVDIPDKRRKNLLTFDPDINLDCFVAIYDTSPFQIAKTGVVFTTHGIYINDAFTKSYFNYKDIISLEVKEAKNKNPKDAALTIVIEKEQLDFTSIFIDKKALKDLLNDIISIVKTWTDEDKNIIIRSSGVIKKEKIAALTKDERIKCHSIIHAASAAAGGVGAGLAQIPLSDSVAIVPIQVTMITSLGVVFGIRVTEGMAKGIISTLTAGFVGRSVSQLLVGWIPGLGNAINTATAAGITEATGWLAVKYFQMLRRDDENKGRTKHIGEGFQIASKIYEDKFKDQVNLFLQVKEIHDDERDNFLELLEKYEQFIIELEITPESYSEENKPKLEKMAEQLVELKKLALDAEASEEED